jgi:hypothetical protein
MISLHQGAHVGGGGGRDERRQRPETGGDMMRVGGRRRSRSNVRETFMVNSNFIRLLLNSNHLHSFTNFTPPSLLPLPI